MVGIGPHVETEGQTSDGCFAADARPVWAVGLNISQDSRTIES